MTGSCRDSSDKEVHARCFCLQIPKRSQKQYGRMKSILYTVQQVLSKESKIILAIWLKIWYKCTVVKKRWSAVT